MGTDRSISIGRKRSIVYDVYIRPPHTPLFTESVYISSRGGWATVKIPVNLLLYKSRMNCDRTKRSGIKTPLGNPTFSLWSVPRVNNAWNSLKKKKKLRLVNSRHSWNRELINDSIQYLYISDERGELARVIFIFRDKWDRFLDIIFLTHQSFHSFGIDFCTIIIKNKIVV